MSNPFAVPGAAVGVTAATTGCILAPPPGLGQGGYGSAVLTNCSPWIATVTCATGSVSLQPFTADIVDVSGVQQLIISMNVPPGGSAIPPPTALTYVQADWYAAGGGLPPGTYPLSLVAQSLQAYGYTPIAAVSSKTEIPLTVTGFALSYFAPVYACTARFATLSVGIDTLTMGTPGEMFIVLVGGGYPLLTMAVPLPATGGPFSQSQTISFPSGISIGANAAGDFAVGATVLNPAVITTIHGIVNATVGAG
jgi:hypothetical protein